MKTVFTISCGMTTAKSVAWGGKNPELFQCCQEAIRYAVSPDRGEDGKTLKAWLESRTKLTLRVEFHLNKQRVSHTDIDSLLADLFNPLVEGACGPREGGKPIPQTKDALFWHVEARKILSEEECIIVVIEPLVDSSS